MSQSGIVYHCIRIQRIITSLGQVFFRKFDKQLLEFMMSLNQNLEDVYFTSPEDIKGKIMFSANEEDVVEYDMDESPSNSRPYSMTEEYVLPNFKQMKIRAPSRQKSIDQDPKSRLSKMSMTKIIIPWQDRSRIAATTVHIQ